MDQDNRILFLTAFIFFFSFRIFSTNALVSVIAVP